MKAATPTTRQAAGAPPTVATIADAVDAWAVMSYDAGTYTPQQHAAIAAAVLDRDDTRHRRNWRAGWPYHVVRRRTYHPPGRVTPAPGPPRLAWANRGGPPLGVWAMFEERIHRTTTTTQTVDERPLDDGPMLQGVSLGDSIRTGLKSTAVALVLVVGVGLVLVAQGHLPAGFWAAGVLVALAVGTLPAALDVIAEHEQAALKRRTARAALQADLLRAETALTTRRYRLVQVEAEQSTRLALVTHREAHRAELTTQDDAADLLRFLSAVYVRGETPAHDVGRDPRQSYPVGAPTGPKIGKPGS